MSLKIVLTGASRGLGRAWTEGFAALGHTVIGCARSQAACDELARAFHRPHRFDAVDVRSAPQVERWARSVLDEIGPPDLLINNAAVIGPHTQLWKASVEDFDECVDINIKGVFYVLKSFVPAMVARKHGVIVNLSSGWGRSTSPEVATYCATKYAIEGMTQALAQELPEGMAAVPLNPGVINTEMLQVAFGDGAGGYPSPEKWAKQAVPYVLSLSAKDNGRPRTVPGQE
jgi:NAD(P)-dependent dehydrogenase (short-subunit alcohol dehydrogenase family)